MIKIVANYETGDSFGHHTVEETLPLTFMDMGKARDALLAIKEHYELYAALNNCWDRPTPKEQAKLLRDAKKKDWFIPSTYNDGYVFTLKLKTDDDKDYTFHAPWCGYFERLHYVEIVDERDKFYFDA